MKRVFEKPVMNVELFVANQAVSSCTIHGQGVEYTFDCMVGPNTDTTNVISSDIPGVTASCKVSIGYASGILTARDYSSRGSHSDNNKKLATWTTGSDGWNGNYLQVTYSGGAGLLYTDGNANTDKSVWSVESGYVKHSSSKGGTHHMVAPVMNPNNMDTSW